jgi:predicted ATPase
MLLTVVTLLVSISGAFGQLSWEITESLDTAGKYNFTRWVDMEAKRIEFEVSVETTGFVGFGLSYTGNMVGADVVIGGVDADGNSYFTVRYIILIQYLFQNGSSG